MEEENRELKMATRSYVEKRTLDTSRDTRTHTKKEAEMQTNTQKNEQNKSNLRSGTQRTTRASLKMKQHEDEARSETMLT